ncbi:DNA cytosine methyltransferase [Nocardia sp. NPDC127526]|uniref:DNA cytosine methyltransferase n=1 Tax=Nocardia sp. NPDC127526 TaxID=3345393 RepID=UPI003635CDCB
MMVTTPPTSHRREPTLLDVCAGGGGLASGLARAGFRPVLLLDSLAQACDTLRLNQPNWQVLQQDLLEFDPAEHPECYDVDLLSAGLPRVKAVAAINRTRSDDNELSLLMATVMLVHGVQPRALLLDNLVDLVTKDTYEPVRGFIEKELTHLGYQWRWFSLNAADFGVPQIRRQGFLVAMRGGLLERFRPPDPLPSDRRTTVGAALGKSMAERGWPDADRWARQADAVAPTLVGGSMDRGGADLGPSGTKRAWARMGVYAGSLGDVVPGPDFAWNPGRGKDGMVRLTVEQTAILQGFPINWQFAGRKTMRYRQIGHATPPPVARALGHAIREAVTEY